MLAIAHPKPYICILLKILVKIMVTQPITNYQSPITKNKHELQI